MVTVRVVSRRSLRRRVLEPQKAEHSDHLGQARFGNAHEAFAAIAQSPASYARYFEAVWPLGLEYVALNRSS